MTPPLTIVVPARNAAATLPRCLAAVFRAAPRAAEVLVVDDGSTDDTAGIAARHGAAVVRMATPAGPARARNAGTTAARAPIVLFVDADVEPAADACTRVLDRLAADPALAAVFGSYDAAPAAGTLVSDYRNLLHHFVHQHASADSASFWAGLGAVRRDVFLAAGGFDGAYGRPSIEDIELGARLSAAGHRIRLDKDLHGKHLKRWTLAGMIRADVFDRARPWSRLILRGGRVPRDLNLQPSHRLSAVLVWLSVMLAVGALALPPFRLALGAAAAGALGIVAALNVDFYRFLATRRGVAFAAAAFPLHAMYYAYASAVFGWCCVESGLSGLTRRTDRRASRR
ncbi:MAG: glycosyltransferase family 2 protein [Vicinamibacterales bacterium]